MSMEEGAFALLEAALQARRRDIDRVGDRIEARRATGARGAEAVDSMGYQLHNLDSAKVGDLAAKVADVRNAFVRDFERFLAVLRPTP